MSRQNPKNTIDVSKLVPPTTGPIIKPTKFNDDFVFNSLGNVIVNSSTSCDLDEAVAKMLGWLRDPLRIHPDEIDIRNISLAQMPYLPKLFYSLDDHLEMLIEKAGDKLVAADSDINTPEQIKSKIMNELLDCEDFIKKAHIYKCAINTELAKEKSSALKVDAKQTDYQNETFITLDSLNAWAKSNFDISLHDDTSVIKNKPQAISAFKTPQRTDDLREEIIEILSTMQNPRPAKVMAALKARIGVVRGTCVVGDIGYGIKWRNGNFQLVELNMKALRERLRNLKKP